MIGQRWDMVMNRPADIYCPPEDIAIVAPRRLPFDMRMDRLLTVIVVARNKALSGSASDAKDWHRIDQLDARYCRAIERWAEGDTR